VFEKLKLYAKIGGGLLIIILLSALRIQATRIDALKQKVKKAQDEIEKQKKQQKISTAESQAPKDAYKKREDVKKKEEEKVHEVMEAETAGDIIDDVNSALADFNTGMQDGTN
jgi:predicted Holliday junction resolvase-like endonuclease